MNEKKVLKSVHERIALDNFKVERDKNKRNKTLCLIAGTAATVFFAGFLTAKVLNDKN